MFVDTRYLNSPGQIEADVCVVGSGPAGVAIALELGQAGLRVCLLESGGFTRDDRTSSLLDGSSSMPSYYIGQGTRSRFLGGSSNCWGGFCRPWDESAFYRRDWVNHSGWPIQRADLDGFYERAQALVGIHEPLYDPNVWMARASGEGPDALRTRHGPARWRPRCMPVDPAQIEEIISQFSGPTRFGEDYHANLEQSPFITVYLWANARELVMNEGGTAIAHLRYATLSGRQGIVRAQRYVLAAGGIENPRLMLASNGQDPAGIGNRYDLVGRFFQDHPRLFGPQVDFTEPYRHNPLFDSKYHIISDDVIVAGQRISGQIRLPYAVQARERIMDAQVWFRSMYVGEGTPVVESLYHMSQRASGLRSPVVGLMDDLMPLIRHPLQAASYTVAHVTGSRRAVRKVVMEMILEPEPDPTSRLTLSAERDALGMPRVEIDWRLTKLATRTVDRTFALIGAALESAGVARVHAGRTLEERGWPERIEGTYHHMGTTRMHPDPRQGVVDTDCRVHGMENLYVAGSSVFPTSSSNHPTITLLALAVRLADHLVHATQGGPPSAISPPQPQLETPRS